MKRTLNFLIIQLLFQDTTSTTHNSGLLLEIASCVKSSIGVEIVSDDDIILKNLCRNKIPEVDKYFNVLFVQGGFLRGIRKPYIHSSSVPRTGYWRQSDASCLEKDDLSLSY